MHTLRSMPRFDFVALIAASNLIVATSLVLSSTALAQTGLEGAVQELPDSEVRQYKDWAVQCRQPESAGSKICVMFQRQVLEDGRTLLVTTVRKTADETDSVATLQLPLGVLLEPGVSISVDDGDTRVLPYRLCNTNGCLVTFALNEQMKTAFTKGEAAQVVVTAANEEPITVRISLNGFSAALNTL